MALAIIIILIIIGTLGENNQTKRMEEGRYFKGLREVANWAWVLVQTSNVTLHDEFSSRQVRGEGF